MAITGEMIYPQLQEIFRDVFDSDSLEINPLVTADDVEGWDSFGHIRLTVAMESHFKIRFSSQEINSWRNVGAIVNSIQALLGDRTSQTVLSNEEFLRTCDMHIAFSYGTENLEFKERITSLINISDPLNYTKLRGATVESVTDDILNGMRYDTWSVFLWDKYDYYGLIGFIAFDRQAKEMVHFLFACRVIHMGIEQAALRHVAAKWPNPGLSNLKIPLPSLIPDWLKEEDFYNFAVRTMIREKEKSTFVEDPAIRIMMTCSSGGVAHFSRYRDIIDFDNATFGAKARHLSFRKIKAGEHEKQDFAPTLVYGAFVDYFNSSWLPDTSPPENGNFMEGLELFRTYFARRNHKILVVLPPDNMPDDKYRPWDGNTRERTKLFNDIWRNYAPSMPFITLLDSGQFIQPQEIPDIAHFYAAGMQKIAQHIDAWYESLNNRVAV